MEEFEFDELVDAVLDLGEGTRGATGQHMDSRGRKQLLQAANGRDRGDEVADMINLHHQNSLDLGVAEQRMPGEHGFHRFVIRPIIV